MCRLEDRLQERLTRQHPLMKEAFVLVPKPEGFVEWAEGAQEDAPLGWARLILGFPDVFLSPGRSCPPKII